MSSRIGEDAGPFGLGPTPTEVIRGLDSLRVEIARARGAAQDAWRRSQTDWARRFISAPSGPGTGLGYDPALFERRQLGMFPPENIDPDDPLTAFLECPEAGTAQEDATGRLVGLEIALAGWEWVFAVADPAADSPPWLLDSDEVTAYCIRALAAAGEPRLVPVLRAHLRSGDLDPRVMAASIEGLGMLRATESGELLSRLIADPDWPPLQRDVRLYVSLCWAATQVAPRRAHEALTESQRVADRFRAAMRNWPEPGTSAAPLTWRNAVHEVEYWEYRNRVTAVALRAANRLAREIEE